MEGVVPHGQWVNSCIANLAGDRSEGGIKAEKEGFGFGGCQRRVT